MKETLEGLSILAKADAGMLEMKTESFDVAKAVEEICALFGDEARIKGLQFAKEIEVETLEMDSSQFNILLQNLLSNAIRYSDKQGEITIGITKLQDAIQVVVKDEGIGIEPDNLSRIFDRFYRVDEARSRQEGGSGLGLSIVKMIVEYNKGNIEASSTVGTGTEIRINFPRA